MTQKTAPLIGVPSRENGYNYRRVADLFADLWLAYAAHGAETLLEFVDAALGIDELLLSGKERMRIRSDAAGYYGVFHTINNLFFLGGFRRTGDVARARGHINEDDGIVFGMKILFHGKYLLPHVPTRGGRENGGNHSCVKTPMKNRLSTGLVGLNCMCAFHVRTFAIRERHTSLRFFYRSGSCIAGN
jgi:hypothetical protein